MPSVRKTYGITKYLPVTKPSGVTADPLFAFHFKPDGDYLTDRTGNARDASVVTGAFEFQQDPETGLYGINFGSGDHELILPAEEALRVAKDDAGGGDASLTLEALVRQELNVSGIILGCDAAGESPQTNYLWQLGPVWNNAGVWQYYSFTEYGNGTNNPVSSTAPAAFDTLIYLVLTISSDGLTWTYYVNAVNVGNYVLTNPAQKNDSGGNAQRVRVGRQESDSVDFKGLLCSLRMTAEVFDQADVTETWNALQGEIGTFYGDADVVQVQDGTAFPDQAGPRVYQSGLSGPQRMPGPATQQSGSQGPFDDVDVFDEAGPAIQLGDSYGNSPGEGVHIPAVAGTEHSVDVFDEASHFLSVLTDYRRDTNDFNGHPHFIGERVLLGFVYDAAAEAGPWTNPTDPSFSGYGKDGHFYLSGVDQGSFAPWYSETESDDRGPDQAFPDKVLICYTVDGVSETPKEVVIFNLDNFPTTLDVWMRFRFGSSGSNYTMMGRVNQKVSDLAMANGILSVVTREGDYLGALHLINFTQPGKDCGHYIRSNNHLIWQPATEIAGRNLTGTSQWNTSGVTVSLRTDEEYIYSVDMWAEGAVTWVTIAGEDPGPNLYRITDYPDWRATPTGEVGDANIGDARRVAFDEDGHWWIAIQNKIFRVPTVDWKDGYAYLDTSVPARRRAGAPEWLELPHNVTQLVPLANYIFVGTEAGVYRVHRGTLDYALAYTIEGGGGGGNNDTPPNGEVIAGGTPEIMSLWGEALHSSHYLYVATRRGATVIRLMDDKPVGAFEFNVLHEPSAHFNVPTID
jgi:hypothetical protein